MATNRLITMSPVDIYIGVTTNVGNAYTAGSPPVGGYTANILYDCTFNAANTGAGTLDGHPLQRNGVALVGGEIATNSDVLLRFDGTNFQLMNYATTPGANGHGASTLTEPPFVSHGSVFISVLDSTAYAIGAYVLASDSTGDNSILTHVVSNDGSGNIVCAGVNAVVVGDPMLIPAGSVLTFAGKPGEGPTTTVAPISLIGGTYQFYVADPAAFSAGLHIGVSSADGANVLEGVLTSITSGSYFTVTPEYVLGDPTLIDFGSLVTFSGARGPTGQTGPTGPAGSGGGSSYIYFA